MWAVENDHATIVELLLEKGADMEPKDNNYGLTPLAWAAWNGYEAVVKLLLKHGAMVDAKDNRQGLTPLSWAALKQHKGVVELLLQKDANTEVFDYYDCTPLAYAIEHRSDAITKLLLVKGAKVNYTYYRIHDDPSILDLSSRSHPNPTNYYPNRQSRHISDRRRAAVPAGAPRGFKLNPLINPGLNTTPLSHAAENGDVGIMKLLIEHGADLELTDYESRSTALFWAVYRGKEAAARLLLEEGANPNATNKYHETPLEYANENKTMAELLRKAQKEYAQRNTTDSGSQVENCDDEGHVYS